MTPTERDRERARDIARDLGLHDSNYCELRDRIAAALAGVRREAMEEVHDEVVRELMGRAVIKAPFDARESEAWEVAAHHVSKFLRAKIGGE